MSDTIPPRSRRDSLSDELDEALGESGLSDVPTVFLVGLSGQIAGKLYRIKPGNSQIGRSSRSFICLDRKAVSHKHAKLHLGPEGCTIEDLESTNGTYLNDEKLTAPRLLNAGDVIRIGNDALGFLTDAEDEQQHTRAMARLTSPKMTPSLLPTDSTQAAGPATIIPVINTPSAELGQFSQLSHVSHVPEEEEVSPLDNALDKLELIYGFLKKNWRTIAVCTVVVGLAGAGAGFLKAPQARAEFEIYLRQEATPDPDRQQNQNFGLQGGEFFAFAERKFSDPVLVRKTFASLQMPDNRQVAASVSSRLNFAQVDKQGTFRGEFFDTDAEFAETFLAAHLQTFLEAEINKSLKVQASEVSLMRQEFERNEDELTAVESELRKFKEEHLQALPEMAQSQIQSRGALLAQRDELAADVSRLSAELALARKQLGSDDVFASSNRERLIPYDSALAEVRRKIIAAESQGLAAGHPELVKLRSEEQSIKQQRDDALRKGPSDLDKSANLEYQRLKSQVGELAVALEAAKNHQGQIESRLGEINEISGKMPEVEADIARLMRKAAAAKEVHERLHLELKGKELELKFERASVAARYEIMTPPHATQPPRYKAVAKTGAMGTVGGLFLGILIGIWQWLANYARGRKIKVSHPTASSTSLTRIE